MIELDNRKLLPPGIHNATLKEVEECFGRFQRSDRRPRLFRKLSEYLGEAKKAGFTVSVILDGSFVMSCVDDPEDIDLLVILPKEWAWDADLKPYQYNLVSKRRVKQEYGFDPALVGEGSDDEQRWISFFGRVNPKWCKLYDWAIDSRKGLVRVSL